VLQQPRERQSAVTAIGSRPQLDHNSEMDAPSAPAVLRPIMLHRWSTMTFVHWPYRPSVVQRLLPGSLEVETVDGQAWIGLLPFRIQNLRIPGSPPAPWISQFPETNVRTYVRGPDGRSAIWFFSLEAARLPAVLAARATYGLRYFWADMSVNQDGRQVRYQSRRRWPGPAGAASRAVVEVGGPLGVDELGELDHFLTARYVLYTFVAGRLVYAHAEHPPWPLTRARVVDLEENLVQAAGLPTPQGQPLVHHSPGVPVRISAWKPVST
jgi:uncharacterized protein YqjF (DUF2071 family)